MIKHQRSAYKENMYEDAFHLSPSSNVGMSHEMAIMASAAASSSAASAKEKI